MLQTTTREHDFVSTRIGDPDGSNVCVLDTIEILDQEGLVSNQTERNQGFSFWRATCWTICSVTAVYTTKQLMVTRAYHFPLTIAFRSFLAILVVYVALLQLKIQSNSIPGAKGTQWGLRLPDGDDFLANSYWAPMIPASVAAAASFPLLLEGILHMPSLPVMVMLFPVIHTAETLVLFICCSESRPRKCLPWEAIVSTAASSAVLYNEYRLMVPGIVYGVTGILLMGLARACFTIGSERSGPNISVQARLNAYHGFVIMTLIFGIMFSSFFMYLFENFEPGVALDNQTLAVMLLNIISVIGTAFSGTSVLSYSPISFEDATTQFSNLPIRGAELLPSATSSLCILLVAIHTSPISYVSWIQIAAYLIASVCLVGADQIHNYVLVYMDMTQQQFNQSFGNKEHESRRPSRFLTSSALVILIVFFGWTLSSFASTSINSLPQSLPTTFDSSYIPPERFEIVVSMYREDPSSVKRMLETLKRTTLLSALEPRIIIYTKDPNQNLYRLKQATGADVVERLDNTGREGGTYLWHIVNKWDELAEQTMFVQAHAHNMRELIPRINDYLIPQTGMLSLGFTGVTCTCETCHDRWSWEDRLGVIPALYEKIYSHSCRPDEPILLTYKGQFVASARRIRGIGIKTFGALLDTITSKEGWSHDISNLDLAGVGNEEDSPSNPHFGFTLERVWGLVMQCATDATVAAKCPSLLSGMGRAGRVEDCQCLDSPVT